MKYLLFFESGCLYYFWALIPYYLVRFFSNVKESHGNISVLLKYIFEKTIFLFIKWGWIAYNQVYLNSVPV